MLRFASDRVYRVSSRWFSGAVFLCLATLHVLYDGQSSSACGMRRPRRSSTFPKVAQTVGSSSHHLAAPDLFRLFPVSWRCSQLCLGSGRVENVRYGFLGLALTTTTTAPQSLNLALNITFSTDFTSSYRENV